MKKVTVYSSEHCRYCKDLKNWLDKNKIDYQTLDVNIPEVAKELTAKGVTGVPYILIEGPSDTKTEIFGFNPIKLEEVILT